MHRFAARELILESLQHNGFYRGAVTHPMIVQRYAHVLDSILHACAKHDFPYISSSKCRMTCSCTVPLKIVQHLVSCSNNCLAVHYVRLVFAPGSWHCARFSLWQFVCVYIPTCGVVYTSMLTLCFCKVCLLYCTEPVM